MYRASTLPSDELWITGKCTMSNALKRHIVSCLTETVCQLLVTMTVMEYIWHILEYDDYSTPLTDMSISSMI